MVKRVVSEIVSYVNADLLERNAARFLPGFSRRRLFKKPGHWDRIFPALEPVLSGEEKSISRTLKDSLERAQRWLLGKQNSLDGHWVSDLRADTTIESDMIMLYLFLGWHNRPAVREKIRRMALFILRSQNEEGGWPIYRNGPSEISATLKAYWALKLAGVEAGDPHLVKARECFFRLGGIHKINSYSKFYLSLFGLYDWAGVPAIPPELMFFPNWFYFNIYEMSSWTRGIVIPLSIVWAKRPKLPLPAHGRLDELFRPGEPRWVPVGGESLNPPEGFFSWRKFFLELDAFLKDMEGRGPYFLRGWALKRAERWMLEHNEKSDGLAAIFPAMLNTILALKALGHPDDHPVLQHNLKELERFYVDHGEDGLEIQPCVSPVWDTAISVMALAESGLRADHPSLIKATRWLLDKEVKMGGDWRVKNTTGPVGGWPFEYENAFYPDIDDTAMVLLALRRVKLEGPFAQAREKAFLRGLNWVLSMQSTNGGWAAFDVDNTKWIFTQIPFADHNAMIDPPTADVTARVLEALGLVGYDKTYPCVQRAVTFLKKEQEADGSWYGRWGVNYIYGTWQVVRGLTCVGENPDDPYIQNALEWLRSVQQPDGGWGERCDTYDDSRLKGKGPSTPSQTAWGIMAFLSCGYTEDPAVVQGIQYLLKTQRPDGSWDETEFTGTGFPKVFYLEYTYYRHYFPLLALGMYKRLTRHRRMPVPFSSLAMTE
ncbi:MAG: squalene--hopene cyclase [Elusimicrobiota bacterium]|jgi:squalene-hopene/tetraprenyl-beta-curcumene cyclase